MRHIATIILCLVALTACQGRAGTTSITRATTDGHDTLFSRTESRNGVTDFHCLASTTGHCHYLVFAEQCQAGQTGACPRRTLQRLDLQPGQRRQVKGLPQGFGMCVDGKVPAEDCARG